VLALGLNTVCVSAADPAATAGGAKAAAVLKVVPAGSAGYVVCNNVNATATAVDKYLAAIGADDMVKGSIPNGALAAFKDKTQLGEGFNADGGLALALLDPQQFGVDVTKAMKHEGDQKMPFVFFVAASSVKDLFSAYKMEEAGKFTKVELRMGSSFATKIGDYVVFSETEKALQAVVDGQAGKKAADELGKAQAKLIDETDFAIQVNMKVVAPLISSAIKQWEDEQAKDGKETAETGGDGDGVARPHRPMALGLAKILPIYKDILGQMDTMTIAGRLAQTGTVLDCLAAWSPDSVIGKAIAAYKPPGTPLLNQVSPDLYILALGQVVVPSTPELLDIQSKAITAMFSGPVMEKLPAETKDKLIALSKRGNEEATSFQLVVGAVPEGNGLFGLSVVINCKDSDKMRAILEDACGVYQSILRAAIGEKDADFKDLTIAYSKGLENVGDKKADAIDISWPDLANMDEQKRGDMKKILGEDKVRIYVLPAAKDKVVLTFGGSKAYLEQAMKAANAASGTLSDKEAGDAAKYLPPQNERVALALLNLGNLFDLSQKASDAMSPAGAAQPMPFTFTAKAPITLGVGLAGANEHIVLFVPNEMVKQVIGIVGMFFGHMGGPGPAMGAEGF
jgi:hypothetical protein